MSKNQCRECGKDSGERLRIGGKWYCNDCKNKKFKKKFDSYREIFVATCPFCHTLNVATGEFIDECYECGAYASFPEDGNVTWFKKKK